MAAIYIVVRGGEEGVPWACNEIRGPPDTTARLHSKSVQYRGRADLRHIKGPGLVVRKQGALVKTIRTAGSLLEIQEYLKPLRPIAACPNQFLMDL